MKKNDVGLDAQVAQLTNALLQMLEIGGDKVVKIKLPAFADLTFVAAQPFAAPLFQTGKGIVCWLVFVIAIMFGEDTEADLVEGGRRQRGEGLLL